MPASEPGRAVLVLRRRHRYPRLNNVEARRLDRLISLTFTSDRRTPEQEQEYEQLTSRMYGWPESCP